MMKRVGRSDFGTTLEFGELYSHYTYVRFNAFQARYLSAKRKIQGADENESKDAKDHDNNNVSNVETAVETDGK
jgi:hypothetical protein